MNAHWSPGRERRLPPPQSGIWGYMPSVVRNALFRLIEPIAFKQFGKPLDRVRKQYGISELGDFRKHYTAGTWCGYMDLPGLVEVDTLPRNHHYIGPVIWKPFGMPFPSGTSNSKRKLAYVSMGTSGNNGLLPAILKALVSHDFSIALSGVSLREEAELREMVQGLSDRCVAAPFFDPDEILQSATLTVCHGGSGTVYQSLKAGVPVIAIPSNPDQTLVAEAAEEKGCGILIDPSRATSQRISEAIAELTTGNRHQKGAQALLEAINDWDTQSVWVGLLNKILPVVLPQKDLAAAKHEAKSLSNISQALRAVSDGVENVPSSPDVVVRPIKNKNELDEVYRITHDAFLERGYCRPQADGRLVHYPRLDQIKETTVFVAVSDGGIVGTISLTLDGPAGLHVDEDFKEACDDIRNEGRKLAAGWRIATRSGYRDERGIVMGLIREVVTRAVDAGVRTGVFTFNPRHESIYQRLLNMKTVARNGETSGLQDAPAVFMRCDAEALPAWCREEVAAVA
ncbi:MAG: nucleotide disphospho-sugar-binding domain-containing protein, partial [Planctomycetota bacterium]